MATSVHLAGTPATPPDLEGGQPVLSKWIPLTGSRGDGTASPGQAELEQTLSSVVAIARDGTGCSAGFVYLVEGPRLVLRAASPVYRYLVGRTSIALGEGLVGWVARNRTPALIRDNALEDPRVKQVPELGDERYQSVAAVPLVGDDGAVTGVLLVHRVAPHEFSDEAVTFLVHTAAVAAGAVERIRLARSNRAQESAIAMHGRLAEALAAVTTRADLCRVLAAGVRGLVDADACHVFRLENGGVGKLAASDPPEALGPAPEDELAAAAREALAQAPTGAMLRAKRDDTALLLLPSPVGRDRLAVLCLRGSAPRALSPEQFELLQAVAHQAALVLRALQLSERATTDTTLCDLFDALDAGDPARAAALSSPAHFDLERPLCALWIEPASAGDRSWRERAHAILGALRAQLPGLLADDRDERLRVLVRVAPAAGQGRATVEEVRQACADVAAGQPLVIGHTGARAGLREAAAALREAADAARIARALDGPGQPRCYDELGAYKVLARLPLDDALRDPVWDGVSKLADYDRRRGSHLVETLEQHLQHWRSAGAASRALFIHPNTLRQRLQRIRDVSGLDLDDVDPLWLELALKVLRLRAGSATADTAG